MQAPPSFTPTTQKSGGSKLWLWILLGFLGCCLLPVGLLAGGGMYVFTKAKGTASCLVNITIVQKALVSYAKAHGDMLPPKENWQSAIADQVTVETAKMGKDGNPLGVLDPKGDWSCKEDGVAFSAYVYNSDFAGKKLAEIKDQNAPLIFEVPTTTQNQAMPYKAQDPTVAPKVLGKPRGWMFVTVGGTLYNHTEKGDKASTTVNFDSK